MLVVQTAPTEAAAGGSFVLGPLPSASRGPIALGTSVGSAFEALRANLLRALLTMLGIVIGVAAVIVVVALGQGARAAVQARLDRLGTNLLTITPGSARVNGVRVGNGSLPTLTELDALAIQRQVPGVASFTPNLIDRNVQVVANDQNWNTEIQGTYPAIFPLHDWHIASGEPIDDNDEATSALVCDIGQTVARNLFGDDDPIGQEILIRNVPFTIKGTLAARGSDGARDSDDLIMIPFSTAQIQLFQRAWISSIYVQVADPAQMDPVQEEIADLLRARHHLQPAWTDDFRIQDNNQVIQSAEDASSTLTLLLASVAAVSLVVGGIGIMNIMLVSVTERTREIGIRLAVGARPSDILAQFLVEAAFLGAVGGSLGILVGAGASVGLGRFAGWQTLVTPPSVALSFAFAASVGVFFGYYPAHRAARLDPVEALRYE